MATKLAKQQKQRRWEGSGLEVPATLRNEVGSSAMGPAACLLHDDGLPATCRPA